MTNERYAELMQGDIGVLSYAKLANNWHFCGDFDGLLMQGDLAVSRDAQTCICGYKFLKPIAEQNEERTSE